MFAISTISNFRTPRDEAVSNPVLRDGVRALLTEKLDRVMPTYLQNLSELRDGIRAASYKPDKRFRKLLKPQRENRR